MKEAIREIRGIVDALEAGKGWRARATEEVRETISTLTFMVVIACLLLERLGLF